MRTSTTSKAVEKGNDLLTSLILVSGRSTRSSRGQKHLVLISGAGTEDLEL